MRLAVGHDQVGAYLIAAERRDATASVGDHAGVVGFIVFGHTELLSLDGILIVDVMLAVVGALNTATPDLKVCGQNLTSFLSELTC